MVSMTPSTHDLRPIRAALDSAEGLDADAALPHLREAAERLTDLLDESMAKAVLEGGVSLRSAGAMAGLSENAVGPRLARTRSLAPYANDTGRVTASGIERAKYDAETGMAPPPPPAPGAPPPMRFKPRRPAT